MKTINTFFQYAYLVIAIFMAYQAFLEYQLGSSKVLFYILISLTAVGMFFFKKHFNKKFKNPKQ